MAGRVAGQKASMHADTIVRQAHEVGHFGSFIFGARWQPVFFDINIRIHDIARRVHRRAIAAALVPFVLGDDREAACGRGMVRVTG